MAIVVEPFQGPGWLLLFYPYITSTAIVVEPFQGPNWLLLFYPYITPVAIVVEPCGFCANYLSIAIDIFKFQKLC
jgi:hypothetical protein